MKRSFLAGLSVASISFGVEAFANIETRDFDLKDLSEIVVQNTRGATVISASEEPRASVQSDKTHFSDRCKLTMDRSGKKLVVKVGRTVAGLMGTDECEVSLDLKVPRNVDVSTETESGSVRVAGTSGNLELKSTSGDLSAEGTFRKVDTKTTSGNVIVKGLTGEGDIKTESGAVTLTMVGTGIAGDLKVKTVSGNALLYFQKGTPIKSNFKGTSGTFKNDLGEREDASYKIFLKTGSGRFEVKAY